MQLILKKLLGGDLFSQMQPKHGFHSLAVRTNKLLRSKLTNSKTASFLGKKAPDIVEFFNFPRLENHETPVDFFLKEEPRPSFMGKTFSTFPKHTTSHEELSKRHTERMFFFSSEVTLIGSEVGHRFSPHKEAAAWETVTNRKTERKEKVFRFLREKPPIWKELSRHNIPTALPSVTRQTHRLSLHFLSFPLIPCNNWRKPSLTQLGRRTKSLPNMQEHSERLWKRQECCRRDKDLVCPVKIAFSMHDSFQSEVMSIWHNTHQKESGKATNNKSYVQVISPLFLMLLCAHWNVAKHASM